MGVYPHPSEPTPFVQPEIVLGMIVSWSGSIIAIPSGWTLCDGTNGTPDLRDRFVQGAGGSFVLGQNAGSTTHAHVFTSSPHLHTVEDGDDFDPGGDKASQTQSDPITATTDLASSLPPYYSLAYIQYTG